MSRTARLLTVLAFTHFALIATAAAAAKPGTIAGELRGNGAWVGAPAQNAVSVAAVAAETGKLGTAGRLAESLRYRLRIPADYYVLFGSASDLETGADYAGNSHVVEVSAGRKVRKNLKLRPARGRASAARPAAKAGGTPRRRGRRDVVTFSPKIAIEDLDGGGRIGPLGLYLGSTLHEAPCPGRQRLREVLHPSQRDILRREIELSNSRPADPSTRLRARFVNPGLEVRGGGQISSGMLTAQAQVVNLETGEVLETADVSGPASWELLEQWRLKLFEALCKEAEHPPWTGSVTSVHEIIPGVFGSSSGSVTFTEDGPGSDYYLPTGSVTQSVSGTDAEGCSYSGGPANYQIGPDDGYLAILRFPDRIDYRIEGALTGEPFTITVQCPDDPPGQSYYINGIWAYTGDGFRQAPPDANVLSGDLSSSSYDFTWSLTSQGGP